MSREVSNLERGGDGGVAIRGYRDLLADATATVPSYDPATALARLGTPDVVFVDVRDGDELAREGKIPGAVHAARGQLEFHLDPASPYFVEGLSPAHELVFYCTDGSRAAFGAQRAMEMGYDRVANVVDGLAGWRRVGGPVVPASATVRSRPCSSS
ncbi:rhodanese-like domain-containing protein [Haloarchaeobius sp. TZWWS8]|uniref:rhodanese-like domain-containing protein n=1 Tax=Haloarchaeobius sp. TZWWS8 TaxID=3446121 RepID=UPI003EB9784F